MAKIPDQLESFDRNSLGDFVKHKQEYCAALTVFKGKLDALPLALERAFFAQDFQSISAEMHSLKGSSASLGFSKLSDACRNLEQSIKQQNQCSPQQLSDVNGWIALSAKDAIKIINANIVAESATDTEGWQENAKHILDLLLSNKVVSIELVNALKAASHATGHAELATTIVNQLMNFEYDEAQQGLQQLLSGE